MLGRNSFCSGRRVFRFAAFASLCLGAASHGATGAEVPSLVRTIRPITLGNTTYETGTWLNIIAGIGQANWVPCGRLPPGKYCATGPTNSRRSLQPYEAYPVDKAAVEPLDRTVNIHWIHARAKRNVSVFTTPGGQLPIRPNEFIVSQSLSAGTDVSVSANLGPFYEINFLTNGSEEWGMAEQSAFDIVDGPPPLLARDDRLVQSTSEPTSSEPGTSNYIIVFLFFAAIAAFFIGVSVYRRRLAAKYAAVPPKGFSPELAKRFPARTIYFVPEIAREIFKSKPDGDPAYREDRDDWWSRMLKMWPEPPKTDADREEREARFWRFYAKHFMVTDSAQRPALKPKQAILDFFQYWEKWIFRDYYAATGVVHKTIIQDLVRHFVEAQTALAMDQKEYPDGYKQRKVEKAIDAENKFLHDTMPAHYEKWGNWFFSNVQKAFNEEHQKQDDFGPQSATSPNDHPASDGITYTPNA